MAAGFRARGRLSVYADCVTFYTTDVRLDATRDDEVDNTIYKVVINHEEQYSIWPADRENPLGWSDVGRSGPKAECLAYIEEVWTDMRPKSMRNALQNQNQQPPGG